MSTKTECDSVLRMVFAANVKRLRTLEGLTQKDFADKLGIHQTEVARMESGRSNVTLERLEQISKTFSVAATSLVEGTCATI